LSLFFFFVLAAHVVHASDLLPQIDVESRSPKDSLSPSTEYRLDEKDIQATSLMTAAQALEKLPGVSFAQNGGPGGRVTLFLRGAESRHTLFLMDGMRLNDTSNTDRQFDAGMLLNGGIERINLQLGPASVLYGTDALGGVIELNTRKGGEKPLSFLQLKAGSFETFQSQLMSDWKGKESQGTLSFQYLKTSGISRLNKKRFKAKEKDKAELIQGLSSSEHKWSESFKTDLLFLANHSQIDLDGFGVDTKSDRSENNQLLVQQRTTYKNKVFFRTGQNTHQRKVISEASGKERYEGSDSQQEILWKPNRGLLVGSLLTQEKSKVDTDKKASELTSFFVSSKNEIYQGVNLATGFRSDHHSIFDTFFNWSAALEFENQNWKSSYQYLTGYKTPSLYQLYAPDFQGQKVGNKKLRPEENTTHQFELWYKKNNHQLGLTLFKTSIERLITFTSQGYKNQNSFRVEGAILSYQWSWKNVKIIQEMTSQAFSHYQAAILRRPLFMSTTRLLYYWSEDFWLDINGRTYSSRRDLDLDGKTVKLNGFSVFDLTMNKKISPSISADFSVSNLLNRDYEEVYGYSVSPRSYYAGFKKEF